MSFQIRIRQKKDHEKIVMLTAYDFQTARILDTEGIDMILVGDSLGMAFQGFSNTRSVTMSDMLYHIRIVARAARNTPIVGDMPIRSCESVETCLKNAEQFVEAGAQAVKIEGNKSMAITRLVKEDFAVMGHVGMLPQSVETYHVKGKTSEEAQMILQDAVELERSGVFAIVLEGIPERLAEKITKTVRVPTIGIGAGRFCDGQVLVVNDLLGIDKDFKPKYVKAYADLEGTIKNAVSKFKEEVLVGKYPDSEHTYH